MASALKQHCKGRFTWNFLSADISQGKKKISVQKCKAKTEHLRPDITLRSIWCLKKMRFHLDHNLNVFSTSETLGLF